MSGKRHYTLSDFSFELPDELIAQFPVTKREESRLLVLNRESGECEHRIFRQLDEYLREGDLLVMNDARVIPARIFFRRVTGGLIEIILTRQLDGESWLALTNKTRRLREHEVLRALSDPSVEIEIVERMAEGIIIKTNTPLDIDTLNRIGEYPLPPYIKREFSEIDSERYQTVFAAADGAIASPTAGLHFSDDLLSRIKKRGVRMVYLTLYVSWGTFQPVRQEDLSRHRMHSEQFILDECTAAEINRARRESRRIIAVGTTVLRVLESTLENGVNLPGHGETDIFIYPPYEIQSIDALITNFHTPHSTLLMLVSAFAGYETIMDAYRIAISERYRFYSYGDAMLIL